MEVRLQKIHEVLSNFFKEKKSISASSYNFLFRFHFNYNRLNPSIF